MDLQTNPQLELAFDYVRNTNKSLFLTGKAGSGKTTFLHQIKDEGTKRLAVVAPTGVAAINAGGMTIHSLFQLPFGLHLPGIRRDPASSQPRFSNQKIRLIRSLDLLVIDEISMVRADLLDAIDEVLRRFCNRSRPFGGLQLLMIGDLHQLPPVVKPEEWDLLRQLYETPYFFSSRALRQTDYVAIELKHIYRQSDQEFISLLNKVRDNRLDEASLREINSRFIADFQPPSNDAYITLTATNAAANEINARNLAQLAGPQRVFQACVTGDFPPASYPTEESLKIKVGAQVMFIKNDTQPDREYFNGKIGRVTTITENAVYVRCPGESSDIEVMPAEWQNVKYLLNEESKQIDEQVVGTFIQYPLKLAWAITIHKSQGLTFERAIIDAQAAFASGQVYVALSRCKSFEGIVLRSRIHRASIKTDPLVQEFCERAEHNQPTESELRQARRQFQATLLQELFRFDSIQDGFEQLRSWYAQYAGALLPTTLDQVQRLAERASAELIDVARMFTPQLAEYLEQEVMPDANEPLQTRVRKASAYFTEKIAALLSEGNQLFAAVGNQEAAMSLAAHLQSLQRELFVKRACFAACRDGFRTDAYRRTKVDAELEFTRSGAAKPPKQTVVPSDVPHPALYQRLRAWRQQVASRDGISVRDVLSSASLRELVTYLPTDNAALRLIHGISKTRRERYGQELCQIIQRFLEEQALPENERARSRSRHVRKSPATSETKRLSFELFRSGKSIDEIADERHLTRGTIENHLSHFIGLGELDVHAVLDRQTVDTIQQFLLAQPDVAATEAKSHFGDKYSYGELRMVISHVLKNHV